ncbi:aldehyde dehydrogenase family protein [Amycolatopsis cynarae]|uniref:Aldehyde dehydrogenase n=1 Tax=Amycolatopsis cynarae TaxID=2995223 RepID=A0ABY7B900_9PSEU|nr:aldehyde dehydrogenase family protein [Amycolatopsis sp. HUAS 11-8]WAL67717.1 aldehyde dehydrogenase family protein [Amycolatopsis sp. HUAS 11-8]
MSAPDSEVAVRPSCPSRPVETIPDVVARLRATFHTGRTRPRQWRVRQLLALERLLAEQEQDLAAALEEDLGRNAVDAWMADLAPVAAESRFARKKLRAWMRDRRVGLPLSARPGRAWYQYEPLGTVLVIGPWNYPVFLTLAPVVAALAAGNCVIVKPSEHTPTVSALLADLLPRYLDSDAVAVVEGAANETQELLDQGLDHAFFTGGPEIGKAVMTGAARHLTPVTLELGGKSPVIVARDADLEVAGRRIAWTKLMNSGQTCVAPDYVLVERAARDELVDHIRRALDAFRTDDRQGLPLVHRRQAERLARLVTDTGGRTAIGGTVDVDALRAHPTIILDPDLDSAVMTEEIFGPVLPVVTVDSLDTAIDFVRARPKPLAVYLFTKSKTAQRRVLAEVSNGGTVINHLMFQVLVNKLPFGGVGTSGMGAYHGEWGFQTFSHRKAVLRKPARPDPSLVYPPYSPAKQRLLRRVF